MKKRTMKWKITEGLKWKTADGQILSPSEMSVSHQINCIRLKARIVIKYTELPYSIACLLALDKWPVLREMASNIAAAKLDPFRDYGHVLVDKEGGDGYPLSDYITLPGDLNVKH